METGLLWPWFLINWQELWSSTNWYSWPVFGPSASSWLRICSFRCQQVISQVLLHHCRAIKVVTSHHCASRSFFKLVFWEQRFLFSILPPWRIEYSFPYRKKICWNLWWPWFMQSYYIKTILFFILHWKIWKTDLTILIIYIKYFGSCQITW